MIGYWIGIIGCWMVSDALFSITLYLNAPSYEGSPKQSWARDHWVRVIWVDSVSFGNDWMDIERAGNLSVQQYETRGFLIKDNLDKIIIAQSRGTDGVHNIMVIPKGCVLEIK